MTSGPKRKSCIKKLYQVLYFGRTLERLNVLDGLIHLHFFALKNHNIVNM